MVPDCKTAPLFLQMASHPLRWQLMAQLAHSDLRVSELSALAGQPQNLVSYHLAQLRSSGLVRVKRSSFDGRENYYHLDLATCSRSLAATGAALHPGLRHEPSAVFTARLDDSRRPTVKTVLFMCTGNSARSQMAEALANTRSSGQLRAVSAGSYPKPLHPNAVRAMAELGIDLAGQRSKHWREFVGERFDSVITLCDRVREVCPEFPGHPDYVHWSIADPALTGETDEASYPAFQATATELDARISYLLSWIDAERATAAAEQTR